MRPSHRFTLPAVVFVALASSASVADDPPPEKGITLMGLLQEWFYPGSKFHGAEMGDAAVSDIMSTKCKAQLTTPDAPEKVMEFYRQHLQVDATGKNLGEKPGERLTTKRSVSIQDNSDGRPLKLYIIAINETGASTTLVVSRAEGEEQTHITWANWRLAGPFRVVGP